MLLIVFAQAELQSMSFFLTSGTAVNFLKVFAVALWERKARIWSRVIAVLFITDAFFSHVNLWVWEHFLITH